VELWQEGALVKMKNQNWQNPCTLVANTQGVFTFWPDYVSADKANLSDTFEFSVIIKADGFEPLNHLFTIPLTSEAGDVESFSMGRTYKLQDLYLFPPGDEED
jgi:competence protein ComFB